MIEQPSDIIWHIMGEEVGMAQGLTHPNEFINQDGLNRARANHDGWKMAFTQNKTINSKKLIEGIARESKLFPFIKGSTLSFNAIQDTYTEAEYDAGYIYDINDKDVISYKFNRTKPEDVKTAIYLNYHYDYASGEFMKSSKDMAIDHTAEDFFNSFDSENSYSNSFHGLEEEQGDDPIEIKYIRHDETIQKLQRFLLTWYCNQHNTAKIKLPLGYLKTEVGDVITFPDLLGNRKAYGEDYSYTYRKTVSAIFRNGQEIFPFWMITATNKALEYVEIEVIQLHNLTNQLTDYAPTGTLHVTPSSYVQPGTQVSCLGGMIDPDTGGMTEMSTDLTEWTYSPELDSLVGFPIENVLQFTAPEVTENTTYWITWITGYEGIQTLPITKTVTVLYEEEFTGQTFNFVAGWNFMGFNLEGLENNAPTDVFSELIDSGNLLFVRGYNNGDYIYDPDLPPFLNTLTSIQVGNGYIIRVANDQSVSFVGGSLIDNSFPKNLIGHWNLISYWGTDGMSPADAFADLIADGNLIAVTGYIGGSQEEGGGYLIFNPTYPSFLNSLTAMVYGQGYWVKLNHTVDNFTYPA